MNTLESLPIVAHVGATAAAPPVPKGVAALPPWPSALLSKTPHDFVEGGHVLVVVVDGLCGRVVEGTK